LLLSSLELDWETHLLDPRVPVLGNLVDGSVGGRRVVLELEFEREGGLGLLRLVEEGHRDGARLRRKADAQRERELGSGDHVVVVLG
jgi:hypothetical protein